VIIGYAYANILISSFSMEVAFDDFYNFLISRHIVDQSKASYYVNWVGWCLKYSRKNFGDELTSTDTEHFLSRISKTKEHWQVDQAALSIRIYQYFIKTRKSADRPASIDEKQQWQYVASEMSNMLRLKQRAISTEKTYLLWLRRFYRFVKGRSPFSLDSSHVKNFLTHQAVDHKVAKSTQDQAFNALLFFYRHVLDKDLDDLTEVVRSRRGRRLPVVLTKSEVAKLLQHLHGVYWLMACIIYGAGLRLSECVKLMIKDIDLETNLITVIGAKGNKDRTTLLAEGIKSELIEHEEKVKRLYQQDRENNLPGIWLPNALERKYPNAGKEWIWQWVFPADNLSMDPRTKVIRRHHIYPFTLQRHIKRAAAAADIAKRVKVHTPGAYCIELRI
jgi:integron integrase